MPKFLKEITFSGQSTPATPDPGYGSVYIDGPTNSLYYIDDNGTTYNLTSGGTGVDTFTTGFTYNNTNTLTISRNEGQPNLTATINTMTGLTIIGNLSATTYQNLPTDVFVTGGTYSAGTATFSNNTGGTFSVTGFTTGGTQNGLNYYVSGSTPTAIQSGDRWFNTNTGLEVVWIDDGDSSQWIQPFSVPGPVSPDLGYYSVTGITTSQVITWDKTYWGVSGLTNIDLTLPATVGKDGYYLIIKDEIGNCGTYRIRITPDSGLIDGNNYIDMNINYMSLTCMVRGGNWYLI